MSCAYYFNYDWITKDIMIGWLFDWGEYDGCLQGPWWNCINCNELFYSTTLCMCESCNPFSGYCRDC